MALLVAISALAILNSNLVSAASGVILWEDANCGGRRYTATPSNGTCTTFPSSLTYQGFQVVLDTGCSVIFYNSDGSDCSSSDSQSIPAGCFSNSNDFSTYHNYNQFKVDCQDAASNSQAAGTPGSAPSTTPVVNLSDLGVSTSASPGTATLSTAVTTSSGTSNPTLINTSTSPLSTTSNPTESANPTGASQNTVAQASASGLSTGAKAGIAVGVVLGVALVAGLIAFVLMGKRRRRSSQRGEYSQPTREYAYGSPPAPYVATAHAPPQQTADVYADSYMTPTSPVQHDSEKLPVQTWQSASTTPVAAVVPATVHEDHDFRQELERAESNRDRIRAADTGSISPVSSLSSFHR